ncbi:hypothetical protein [Humibacter sp. RRB41]|uniref:hypothetical protein n=1 Tax=Humibacter sp. RRB41 TaxID=2919946 RepID=UPI001FAA9A03|nr:hypothetical protein [Humibacter sp. RRB41]
MKRIRVLPNNQARDPREGVDVMLGAVGFFGVGFFVITVVSEITGADALGWALTLLAFVIAFAGLLVVRRRITDRVTATRSAEEAAGHRSSP